MARLNLYIHLPPLFELARGSTDAIQFETDLQALEVKLLRETAEKLATTAADVNDSARQTAMHDRVKEIQGAVEKLAPPNKPDATPVVEAPAPDVDSPHDDAPSASQPAAP